MVTGVRKTVQTGKVLSLLMTRFQRSRSQDVVDDVAIVMLLIVLGSTQVIFLT